MVSIISRVFFIWNHTDLFTIVKVFIIKHIHRTNVSIPLQTAFRTHFKCVNVMSLQGTPQPN